MPETREIVLTERDLPALAAGSAFWGGGGGGWVNDGLAWARSALARGCGCIAVLPPDRLADGDVVVTISVVGAPSAEERCVRPDDLLEAVELLRRNTPTGVRGLISSEIGGMSTFAPWVPGAVLGIPVLDAACDGRAHPTGVMGAMGLEGRAGYVARQAACGGGAGARHVSVYVEGPVRAADSLVRGAAVQAGGLVAVARNPVEMGYVRANGACGAVSAALAVGRVIESARAGAGVEVTSGGGSEAVAHPTAGGVADAVAEGLAAAGIGARVVAGTRVEAVAIRTEGGFDIGLISLAGGFEVTFWNEFVTLEKAGERLATFPDLIVTLDGATGLPLASAETVAGIEVVLVIVPKEGVLLGGGVLEAGNLTAIERATGKEILQYL